MIWAVHLDFNTTAVRRGQSECTSGFATSTHKLQRVSKLGNNMTEIRKTPAGEIAV
jgi:hypothetical protein